MLIKTEEGWVQMQPLNYHEAGPKNPKIPGVPFGYQDFGYDSFEDWVRKSLGL